MKTNNLKEMKTIKQWFAFILLLLMGLKVCAEEKNIVRADTIRIRFENALLEVAAINFGKFTLEQAGIPSKINALYAEIKKIHLPDRGEGERMWFRMSNFVGGKERKFSELDLTSEIINNKNLVAFEGQLLERDFGNVVLETEDRNYLVRLYLKKMEDVELVNSARFVEKLKVADSAIPHSRKKISGWLIENQSGSFNQYFLEEVPPYSLDMLELGAGVGGGWIKNQFVSGFNFRVGIGLATKGIIKNKYFADYELLYDFTYPQLKSGFRELNGFLSVGFEKNFSMNPGKANWYGISVGFLVIRDNDFFEDKTFKLAVHKQLSSSILLKPEIYFNNFFKKGYPGLRVQVSF